MTLKLKRRRGAIGIPVVAMSDIAFLLLIFLMVSSMSSPKKNMRLELPQVQAAQKERIKDSEDVFVTRDGKYFAGGREVTLRELDEKLEAMSPERGVVFVYGEENTPYDHIDNVVKLLYRNDLRKCVFVTRKMKQ